jgi:hypothetical protein
MCGGCAAASTAPRPFLYAALAVWMDRLKDDVVGGRDGVDAAGEGERSVIFERPRLGG